jgi:hypothetical protein
MTLKKALILIVAVLPIVLSVFLFSLITIFDLISLSVGFFFIGVGFCATGILLEIFNISMIKGGKRPPFLVGIGLGLLVPLVFISFIGKSGNEEMMTTQTPTPIHYSEVIRNRLYEPTQQITLANEEYSFFDEKVWNVVSSKNTKPITYHDQYLDFSPFGFYSRYEVTSLEQNQFLINSPAVSYVNSYAAVKRLNDSDNQYLIQISNLELKSSTDCEANCSCDTQLFVGIGEPFQYEQANPSILVTGNDTKSGFFLIFRKYQDHRSGKYKIRVCLLDSLYSSCDQPLSQIDNITDSELYHSTWEIEIKKQGQQVTFDVVEKKLSGEERTLTTINDNSAITSNADLFYIGYNIKNYGFVNAIITLN